MYNNIGGLSVPPLSDQNSSPQTSKRARSQSWDAATRQILKASLDALPDKEACKREMLREKRLSLIQEDDNVSDTSTLADRMNTEKLKKINYNPIKSYIQKGKIFWNQVIYPSLVWLLQKIKDLWNQNAAFIRENAIFIFTFFKSLKLHKIGRLQGGLFNASLFNITVHYHASSSFSHLPSYANEIGHNLSHSSSVNEITVNG
jgi:hypothetical protein